MASNLCWNLLCIIQSNLGSKNPSVLNAFLSLKKSIRDVCLNIRNVCLNIQDVRLKYLMSALSICMVEIQDNILDVTLDTVNGLIGLLWMSLWTLALTSGVSSS